jgi:hypothetical protein
MSGGLFTRRGNYTIAERLERLQKHRVSVLQTLAAEREVPLPAGFVQARSARVALTILRGALDHDSFDAFIREAFAVLGAFGDDGQVTVLRLTSESVPEPRAPLFADGVDTDLNAHSVASAISYGRSPSNAVLEETFRQGRQAAFRIRFEDPEPRIVSEDGVMVERIEYIPRYVDGVYDAARRSLFVHGGARHHVIRVQQLVSGALQGSAGGAVVFDRPPALSEPVLYAIVNALDAVHPGGELRLFDPTMRKMRYGTTTDEDVRLSETGQRIKQEGLARAVEANVPHEALAPHGAPRIVRLQIDEDWSVRLRDPLEPEGYFALYDRIQRWHAAGSWLRPLEVLSRESLERTNLAASQTDISDHTRRVREDLLRALGALVPPDATWHQKDMLATLAANALIRALPAAAKLRGGDKVAIGPDLTRFLNEHAALGGITLDENRRMGLLRRTWKLLQDAKGDLLAFVEGADGVT